MPAVPTNLNPCSTSSFIVLRRLVCRVLALEAINDEGGAGAVSWGWTEDLDANAASVAVDMDAVLAPAWVDSEEKLSGAFIFRTGAIGELAISDIEVVGRVWTFRFLGLAATGHALALRFQNFV